MTAASGHMSLTLTSLSLQDSVEIAAALRGPALADHFDVLDRELVVVRDLLVHLDVPQRKQHNVLHTVHRHHFAVAVWLAAVVDVAGGVALEHGVDDQFVVDPEHVRALPLLQSAVVAHVPHQMPHELPNILDHHVVFVDVSCCEEAEVVYGAA
eukprot:CAMPEP_0202842042 /NCGR_PEP_ID=MMETSP1389-20130828/60338_1 /ASSEMBLY_ACC=CAM_ASM_000865 /TAXON_ID=302021 /ORGANISM="Rhodomonas sp., Strain CCMP768" /LENGTH=153 /DNA_ID=CAMNT_0049518939 /DNA_START=94 /DNA_END=552 /DNA_ORIENTATION=+